MDEVSFAGKSVDYPREDLFIDVANPPCVDHFLNGTLCIFSTSSCMFTPAYVLNDMSNSRSGAKKKMFMYVVDLSC